MTVILSNRNGTISSFNSASGQLSQLAQSSVDFTDVAVSPSRQIFAISFNNLYNISTSTGVVELIGSLLGAFNFNALGFSSSGILYGISNNGSSSSLYQISTANAATTFISNLSFISSGDLEFDGINNRFFATGLNSSGGNDLLYSVQLSANSSLPNVTLIGDTGYRNVWGLALEGSDLLGYTNIGQEISINTSSGVGSFRKNISASGLISGADSLISTTPKLNSPIRRFQNTSQPGTFLFAGEAESVSIRNNFKNFKEEGLAFQVGVEKNDPLLEPLFRFQNTNQPGTFLFVGEVEAVSVRNNFKNFKEEGLAFYVYGASSGIGTTYNRFQNTSQPGTFLFAGPEESKSILANFKNFVLEGAAFNVG